MASGRDNVQLLLGDVNTTKRTEIIHEIVGRIDQQSEGTEIGFAAALLRQYPNAKAQQSLIDRILTGIETGDIEKAVSVCKKNVELRDDVVPAASHFIISGTRRLIKMGWLSTGSPVVHLDLAQSFSLLAIDPDSREFELSEGRLVMLLDSYLRFLAAVQQETLAGVQTEMLLQACLVLAGDKGMFAPAQEAIFAIINHCEPILSCQKWLWQQIEALVTVKEGTCNTRGLSLWLQWINCPHPISPHFLTQTSYWTFLVQGLRQGDSERRKSCGYILRRSIDLAVESTNMDSLKLLADPKFTPSEVRDQYFRFCTVFETIILGRYLNQVQECEADLDFLSSSKSAVKPVWLFTLLASALDQKMQDANRKFIGAWIMRTSMRTDDPIGFATFYRNAFLPWAMQGYLYTSSLRKEGPGFRCQHGEVLAQYVSRLLCQSNAIALGTIDSIVDILTERHGNNFAYAMVYLMEGIGLGISMNKDLIIAPDQLAKLSEIVSWIGLPEVARDYVLARFWKICKDQSARRSDTAPEMAQTNVVNSAVVCWERLIEKSHQLGTPKSAHIDGSVASLSFPLSRREKNEQLTSQKCEDLIREVQRDDSPLLVGATFEERLNDIWSDIEYLEFPKGLLINVSYMPLNSHIIRAATADAGQASALSKFIQDFRKLVVSRSYLLPPLLAEVRRTALQSDQDISTILDLEDFVVDLAESPPSPTVDSRLEDAAVSLMPSISPEVLAKFDYDYYFGQRESIGYAALLDVVSRLGTRHPHVIRNIFDRLLQRWKEQKTPPPTVSPWKKIIQLQIMLLCSEQIIPSVDHVEAEGILRDLHYVLAIEPLPRYRYLLEWMIARTYIHHPELNLIIFKELDTKDHHSNPKFLASLMKIGVTIAKTETSGEDFALRLATVFVPLAASSKVVIRHEAQWQVPILLDHARAKEWKSIAGSTAFDALDQYIRSLERFGDPPLERQIDKLDPIKDHNLTHLVEGPWFDLDIVEQRHCGYRDFQTIYASDRERHIELPPSCMPLGGPVAARPSNKDDPAAQNDKHDRTVNQNIDNISRALGCGPGPAPTALQTKGAAYLESESSRARFTNLLVVASLVDNPYNLGGLSRVSEIFGAGAMYVPNIGVTSSKDFTAVSVASHQHIPIHPLPAVEVAAFLAEKKRNEGFKVLGIEQTDRSVMLGDERCVLPEKCVLVMGSEREGIPALILSECDILVEIPQIGITRSLNVQTAAGIVLCEYARQRKVKNG